MDLTGNVPSTMLRSPARVGYGDFCLLFIWQHNLRPEVLILEDYLRKQVFSRVVLAIIVAISIIAWG